MKVEECIFFQLRKATQAGIEFWGKKVAHLKITPVQALVLNFLGEEDATTSHHLGQRLQLTSATLTGILDRLEKMDLIERRPHPEDRRAILVCLTETGARYSAEISELFVEANREFLEGLNGEEEILFRGILKRLKS